MVFAGLFIGGCRTVPVAPTPVAITPPSPVPPISPTAKPSALIRLAPQQYPEFIDDASTVSLRRAAVASAAYFHSLSPSISYQIAQDTYSAADLADSMDSLVAAIDSGTWRHVLAHEFAVYQSIGRDEARTVTFSSYYEPTVPARLTRSAEYSAPIYGRPADLVDVDLSLFDPAWQGIRVEGRRYGSQLVPYYTRQDIDSLGALKGRGNEIAWAKDPLDAFFLQVEGSGWLDLGNGRTVRIRFDGHNGRKYGSVGQYLIQSGRIPKERFSHQAFVRYMHDHPKERQSLLNLNPRYVFFRIDTSSAAPDAYGNIGVALTPGRSIATDPKLFPKGVLCWVGIEGKSPLRRFVLNQDEGGAIQGPARVDFFAGHGADAETFAFHLWNPGTLYVLVRQKNGLSH